MRSSPTELILSFTQIGAMLRARKTLIFNVTVAAVVIAAVVSLILPKTYVASANIYIDYRINDPINGRQFNPMQDESYLETQFDLIRSVQVAQRVIESLRLQDTDDFRTLVAKYGEQRSLRQLASTWKLHHTKIAELSRSNIRLIILKKRKTLLTQS